MAIIGTANIASTKNGERFTVVFGVKVKDPVKELFKSSFLFNLQKSLIIAEIVHKIGCGFIHLVRQPGSNVGNRSQDGHLLLRPIVLLYSVLKILYLD